MHLTAVSDDLLPDTQTITGDAPYRVSWHGKTLTGHCLDSAFFAYCKHILAVQSKSDVLLMRKVPAGWE